jgi:hypothetical protein
MTENSLSKEERLKESKKKYHKSPRGKLAAKKYYFTEKGQLAHKRSQAKQKRFKEMEKFLKENPKEGIVGIPSPPGKNVESI